MKKISLLFLIVFLFVGCTKQTNIPNLNDEFTTNAIIQVGDFSYNAEIKWQNNVVYVTATSTNAKGLTMSCDGHNLIYSYCGMIKKADVTKINYDNPAVILYKAFSNNDLLTGENGNPLSYDFGDVSIKFY